MAANYHSPRAPRKPHPFTPGGAFASLLPMTPAGKLSQTLPSWGTAETIASRENRWLKRFRAALRGGKPATEGSIGVEGARLVEEALRSGLRVEAVLVSASGDRHLARLSPWIESGVPVLRTTDRLFAGVADTQTPQGVAALVQPRPARFDDLIRGLPLVVVLVGVQDPGNVGTILRAAEAFGATGAATCSAGPLGTADPLGPKALRASAGSALRLPVLDSLPASNLISKLRASRVKLFAATKDQVEQAIGEGPPLLRPWEADWKSPAAVLIGNEGAGLPEEMARATDARVSMPQAATTAPVGFLLLKAAMAAPVLLYEAMCQRTSKS